MENVVLASPAQMEFIIEGMRNPMNSWEKSDSYSSYTLNVGNKTAFKAFNLGEADHSLMQRLSNAGTDHRKFMRMMPVYVRITAPLYWWKEFDTYKVGTVANSCSTMHKIAEKEFTLEDFSCEHLLNGTSELFNEFYEFIYDDSYISPIRELQDTILDLNAWRDFYIYYKNKSYTNQKTHSENLKKIWWQMIQLLPSSYNQTRNVMMNYEVLANIYKSRKDHKLDEWREFCRWIESLPYSELIISTSSGCENKVNKSDVRWAEDIFKNHGIKLTEAQIDAINSIGTTNIITSEEMINGIDSDTTTDAAVDYAVQMAKDAARHYSFEKEE